MTEVYLILYNTWKIDDASFKYVSYFITLSNFRTFLLFVDSICFCFIFLYFLGILKSLCADKSYSTLELLDAQINLKTGI